MIIILHQPPKFCEDICLHFLLFFSHSDHKQVHNIIYVIFLAFLDIRVLAKYSKFNINIK